MENIQLEQIQIKKINWDRCESSADFVAVEEPLEIRLEYSTKDGRLQKPVSVTMRTPGNDAELAAGFLFTEGIIKSTSSIKSIKHIAGDVNRILVVLAENISPELNSLERNFYISSSCGICGKSSIEAIHTVSGAVPVNDDLQVQPSVIYALPGMIKKQQQVFEKTGGLHASALFNVSGKIIFLREDIGRHNAVDKIIGAAMQEKMPPENYILFLSGRAGFELVQKSVMAGIKIVAAVGAPSSLAVELAKDSGVTLIGFLRGTGFNIYSGDHRIQE